MAIPSSFVDAPTNIYEHPYSVITKYEFYGESYEGAYYANFDISVPEYSGMNNALKMLVSTVRDAENFERQKEEKLFKSFIDKLPKGSALRNDFENFISSKNYSKAFDIYEKFSQGIYKFEETFEENKKRFKEKNNLFLSKEFLSSLANELSRSSLNPFESGATFGDLDLENLSINDIIDNVINRVKENALKTVTLDDKEQEAYENFLNLMREYMQGIFGESFPDVLMKINNPYDLKLVELEKSNWIKTKRKEKKYSKVPLNKLIWNNVWGQLNGMSLEVSLDLFGGVKTGKIQQNNNSIKTDVIMIADGEGQLLLKENEIIKELNKVVNDKDNATKNNLDTFLSSGKLKDKFVIMISAKDQSSAKGFENYHASTAIKMAEQSSLNKRMEDLRTFGTAANIMGKGVSDLMFALVNLEEDMVCAGEEELVKRALGALCANWMFDDVAETFNTVPSILGSDDDVTKIYIYNISGAYYTLSDILGKTAERIEKQQNSQMVSVQFKVSNGSYENAKNVPAGLARWEKVNQNVMSNTTFGFKLNSNNLFKQLFN